MDEPDVTRTAQTTYDRETHTRWAHKNPGGMWWMALAAVPLLLAALATVATAGGIESGLDDRAQSALASAGIDADQLEVSWSGRDATIGAASGASLSADDLERARGIVGGLEGVRVADVDPAALEAAAAGEDEGAGTNPTPTPTPTPTPLPSPSESAEASGVNCAADAAQAQIDEILGEDKLQFGEKSAAVEGAASQEIADVAAYLTECGDVSILVTGNTDPRGAKGTLSIRRAKAVKKALVDAGIAAARIEASGERASSPIADNATQAGRDLNRYAAITVK